MTGLTGTIYQRVVKPVLFHFDPEDVHDRMLALGKHLGEHRVTRMMTSKMWSYAHSALEQTPAGLRFPNPSWIDCCTR